ncbi:Brp/Blh family beta-carotene 15,15'-dioxygenase [Psychroflexus aestuariivivens]|uniref:Brp/Blh family beta-carotene 15,15'-dioxygenase n=1 Tax=Psychroflexus aestuariivivens TaxID=1795040 RepID=UPI001F015B70|nr:Brp/Blh family beta-carotene 15,15'-dioxygenase [Psychroflexus aestuariivivens]
MFSFFCIWLNIYLPPYFLQILSISAILSFGLLHGSNDLLVIKKLKMSPSNFSFWSILGFYIGLILIFVLIFSNFTILALFFFIAISAYHFGEQHWQNYFSERNFLSLLFYFFYGLLILNLIFYLNQNEVIVIIHNMTNLTLKTTYFQWSLIISCIGTVGLGSLFAFKNDKFKQSIPINIFYLLVLSVIFYASDVLWGFTVYFVLWHSLPSLKDQIKTLYGTFNFKNFKRYFSRAFWYWLISILGMGVVIWWFKDDQNFLSLLFAFIAAVSFPHVFVMKKLFQKNNN